MDKFKTKITARQKQRVINPDIGNWLARRCMFQLVFCVDVWC